MFNFLAQYYDLIIAIAALGLSLAAFGLSFVAFFRTRNLQDYDYKARLDLLDEDISFSVESLPEGFRYSALIRNNGSKSLEIVGLRMDCGSSADPSRRMKHRLEGSSHLPPGESVAIQFQLKQSDVRATMKKLEVEECLFFLRVSYKDTRSKVVYVERELGGYSDEALRVIVPGGSTLT